MRFLDQHFVLINTSYSASNLRDCGPYSIAASEQYTAHHPRSPPFWLTVQFNHTFVKNAEKLERNWDGSWANAGGRCREPHRGCGMCLTERAAESRCMEFVFASQSLQSAPLDFCPPLSSTLDCPESSCDISVSLQTHLYSNPRGHPTNWL